MEQIKTSQQNSSFKKSRNLDQQEDTIDDPYKTFKSIRTSQNSNINRYNPFKPSQSFVKSEANTSRSMTIYFLIYIFLIREKSICYQASDHLRPYKHLQNGASTLM